MSSLAPVRPAGSTAVMARRKPTPPGELDYFPTPPWATRALFPILRELDPELGMSRVWEPACGEGHMAETLNEAFGGMFASDVFDYGYGEVFDFLAPDRSAVEADWIITNPPFKSAEAFVHQALLYAQRGVAMFVRSAFLEGATRHRRLFTRHPPRIHAVFSERVPLARGEWKPKGSTATAYSWLIWTAGHTGETVQRWIPPGRKAALTLATDAPRFARLSVAPLLETGS